MTFIAAGVFERFVATVLKEGAFSDEERARPSVPDGAQIPLSDERAKQIAKGKAIDTRVPHLMRVSGKGGRAPRGVDPERYVRFRNATLLDHLTSVVRGALVIGEIDLRAAGVPEAELPTRLVRVAAVAFLHDADKMLGVPRGHALTPDDLSNLAARYRVGTFLEGYGLSMGGAELLQLVSNAETTRHDRLVPGAAMTMRDDADDCAYVRLADRLDGAFLDDTKGAEGVLRELREFEGLRTDALAREWRALSIRAPQTPFLLDELQIEFSEAIFEITRLPPLIEVHHDGVLTLVAPEAVWREAFELALTAVRGRFSSGLRVMTNTRGARDLLDGRGGVRDVSAFFEMQPAECAKALFVHRRLAQDDRAKERIEHYLDALGLGPSWPDLHRFQGQHVQAWKSDSGEDADRAARLVDAGTAAVSLACPPPKGRVAAQRAPDDAVRERELLELLSRHAAAPPDWLVEMAHKLSRQTLLGLHLAGRSTRDMSLHEAAFGPGGLLDGWLRGADGRSGVLEKNEDPGAVLGDAACEWLRAQAGGDFYDGGAAEGIGGRCHFTNLPVRTDRSVDTKSGLYGLNVSAFSGRASRPESHLSAKSQTLVARAAAAEHRLRALRNGGGTAGDVPAYVSSPTSAGLFWSLRTSKGPQRDLTLYDVVRAKREAGKALLIEGDAAEAGTRDMIGRYAAVPTHLAKRGTAPGLLGFAAIVVDAALRAGRPIHVFRGLPRPSNAFVLIDCLPRPVERAFAEQFGSPDLRLEDLPAASRLLRLAEEVAATSGLGPDVAMDLMSPRTRLAAGCIAVSVLKRADADKTRALHVRIRALTRKSFMDASPDDPILAFARAMSRVQAAPRRGASGAELEFGLRAAVEAVAGAHRIDHGSRESLVAAVAGGLAEELGRGRVGWPGRAKGAPFPEERAREAAELFVDRVWRDAFRGRAPAARARRSAFAIYRFAFTEASRAKFADVATEPAASPA